MFSASLALAATVATTPAVIGYLPDYRVAGYEMDRLAGITDLVYFSIEPTPTGGLDLSRLKPDNLQILKKAKKEKNFRLLLAVGGWNRSEGFATAAPDSRYRAKLVQNLLNFCVQNEIDGVDYDWEHPADESQQEAYADLIVDTKRAFAPRGLMVTAAVAGWQKIPSHGLAALDRVHLMSYDRPGDHSTFDQAKADVNSMLKRGVRAKRLALGVPFYGRSREDSAKAISYAEIARTFDLKESADEAGEFYFNGPQTIRRKAKFAKETDLAGIMVWELGQDASGDKSLLAVISNELKAE